MGNRYGSLSYAVRPTPIRDPTIRSALNWCPTETDVEIAKANMKTLGMAGNDVRREL